MAIGDSVRKATERQKAAQDAIRKAAEQLPRQPTGVSIGGDVAGGASGQR